MDPKKKQLEIKYQITLDILFLFLDVEKKKSQISKEIFFTDFKNKTRPGVGPANNFFDGDAKKNIFFDSKLQLRLFVETMKINKQNN